MIILPSALVCAGNLIEYAFLIGLNGLRTHYLAVGGIFLWIKDKIV